jgi:hypothetical protein
MADQEQDDIQRWTTKRKVALVVSIIKGETGIQEAARRHAVTVAEIEEWQERFFLGAENALRARPKDEEALKDEQIKKLKQKISDLVIDIDILREAADCHLQGCKGQLHAQMHGKCASHNPPTPAVQHNRDAKKPLLRPDSKRASAARLPPQARRDARASERGGPQRAARTAASGGRVRPGEQSWTGHLRRGGLFFCALRGTPRLLGNAMDDVEG